MTERMRVTQATPLSRPAQEAGSDDEIDLLDLFRVLWRGKGWIALSMLLAVMAGAYYAYVMATPLYTAHAVVALEGRQSNARDIASIVSGLTADPATINTEKELMRSRRLTEKVVNDLDLLDDPEFNSAARVTEPWTTGWLKEQLLGSGEPMSEAEAFDRTVDNLLEQVKVDNARDSYVFTITAETSSPQKSATIANKMAEVYRADQVEFKFEETERATIWLSERVVSLKEDLEEVETELNEFTSVTELVSPEALSALGVQLKDLRERLASADARHGELIARREALAKAATSGDPQELATIADDAALERLAERIAGGADAMEAFERRQEEVLRRAEQDIARSEREATLLERAIEELEQRIDRQSRELINLHQLEREVEATSLIYQSFLSNLKETSIQQGLHRPDARIFSDAVIRKSPTSPRKKLVLGFAMLFGLFAGSGFVLLRERMQSGFRTAEELEAFSEMGVIGETPLAPTRRRKQLPDYLIAKPQSAYAEAVRNLRTSVLLSQSEKGPPKVVMLTSSVPGEGKSTLTVSLAQNLSGLGMRVLLIEADLRRGTLSEFVEAGGERPGLISAVTGRHPLSDAVLQSETLGVDLLLREEGSANAADFFSSPDFARFMSSIREAYDIVLIDSPPVLAVTDARIIGQYADAILYVVRWDGTPRTQLAAGLRRLKSLGLKVSGLVLNQIDRKRMKGYGDEGYGSYGAYYNS